MKKIALAMLIVWSAQLHAADTARLLPFQGRLTDAQGQSVGDGAKLIQFQIYGEPTGGGALWAGEVHRTTVNGGLVNVMLGSKNLLPVNRADNPDRSFFDASLYLQITVDGNNDGKIDQADPPLLPRQAILPVVFAHESGNARKLVGYDWSALLSTADPATGTLLDAKIRAGSIDGTKLRPETITSNQIAPLQINASLMARETITSNQIAAMTITSNQLAPQTISTTQIADGAITQAKRGPVNIQISEFVDNFSCSDCSVDTDVPNLTVTLTTSGRPVCISLVGSTPGSDSSFIQIVGGNERNGRVQIYDGRAGTRTRVRAYLL